MRRDEEPTDVYASPMGSSPDVTREAEQAARPPKIKLEPCKLLMGYDPVRSELDRDGRSW